MFDYSRITPGEFVQYMNDPGSPDSNAMMVIAVGESSIEGMVWDKNNIGSAMIRTAVHASDERLRDPQFVHVMADDDTGVFTESKAKTDLLAKVADLHSRIVDLEQRTRDRTPKGKGGQKVETKNDNADDDADLSDSQPAETVLLSDLLPKSKPQDPKAKAEAIAAGRA